MKALILVCALILVGCGRVVYPYEVEAAEATCKDRKGLMYMDLPIVLYAKCIDGTYTRVILK